MEKAGRVRHKKLNRRCFIQSAAWKESNANCKVGIFFNLGLIYVSCQANFWKCKSWCVIRNLWTFRHLDFSEMSEVLDTNLKPQSWRMTKRTSHLQVFFQRVKIVEVRIRVDGPWSVGLGIHSRVNQWYHTYLFWFSQNALREASGLLFCHITAAQCQGAHAVFICSGA